MSVNRKFLSLFGATALTRLLTGVVLGAFVTLGLLWTMQYLIATADKTLDEGKAGNIVDFVRLKRDESVQRKSNKPEKPPAPKTPPPQPPQPKMEDANPKAEKMEMVEVNIAAEVELSADGFSLSQGEGDYLPIIKVAPVYPRRAANRGIEGFVLVEFTVTRKGTVKDVKVLDSEPKSSIFYKSAKRAALKFKYKPRVIDGKAVEVTGVRNLIRFKLED